MEQTTLRGVVDEENNRYYGQGTGENPRHRPSETLNTGS